MFSDAQTPDDAVAAALDIEERDQIALEMSEQIIEALSDEFLNDILMEIHDSEVSSQITLDNQ